jgi:hypothetical protein
LNSGALSSSLGRYSCRHPLPKQDCLTYVEHMWGIIITFFNTIF